MGKKASLGRGCGSTSHWSCFFSLSFCHLFVESLCQCYICLEEDLPHFKHVGDPSTYTDLKKASAYFRSASEHYAPHSFIPQHEEPLGVTYNIKKKGWGVLRNIFPMQLVTLLQGRLQRCM